MLSLRLLAVTVLAAVLLAAASLPAEITIQSYHLRDRALVLDSLVMRKHLIFQFRSSLPLGKLKGAAAAGELRHGDQVIARDTTWMVDEPGGNLGFGLPYAIPAGSYHLSLRLVAPDGTVLDSFQGEFDRARMKLFYNREVNFWDYTTPYAHLQCAGYGSVSWQFEAGRAVAPRALELTARLATDNSEAGRVRLALNGTSLGVFDLPAGESDRTPEPVTLKVGPGGFPAGAALRAGRNELTLSVEAADNPQAMGLRVFGRKNSPDPGPAPGRELTLQVEGPAGASFAFEIPVWGEDGENVRSEFTQPFAMSFTRRRPRADDGRLQVGAEDVARGLVPFQRHYLRPVYPWTVPADSERVDRLALTMARNEFEPLTIALYPLRELGLVRLELGELVGPGGAVLPTSLAKIHVARHLKIRTGGSAYELVPRLLARLDTVRVPVDYTTRFWVTLHVPPGTAPGEYRGVVRLRPEREPALELPLVLRVLPVTLEEVPEPRIQHAHELRVFRAGEQGPERDGKAEGLCGWSGDFP